MPKNANICHNCGRKADKKTNYCHHCGKSLKTIHQAFNRCMSCKRTIDESSKYCKHCGFDLAKSKKRRPHSALLHFIVLLILLLALFLLYSYPSKIDDNAPIVSETPGEPEVSISNINCADAGSRFHLCGDVSWKGAAYAQAYIPGGISLEESKKYFEPFTICEDIDGEDGYRVLRAFVYDTKGNVIADAGEGVECVGNPSIGDEHGAYTLVKSFQFFSERKQGQREGLGSVNVNFPDKVLSCNVSGKFVVDDGGAKAGSRSIGSKQYCDGAEGSFLGYADAYRQSVTVDSSIFKWDGRTYTDPDPLDVEDNVLYAYTCDTQYYRTQRYYTSAVVTGFGTDSLKFDWYYFNDDTHPRVYWFVDLVCQLEG